MPRSKTDQDLIHRLNGADVDAAIDSARSLASVGMVSAIPALQRVLSSTSSASVRNAAALALGDLGDDGLVPIIARLLVDPRTAGCRSSLVYAVEAADNRPLLRVLTQLVITGAFEARHQAHQNIASIDEEVDQGCLEACRRMVLEAIPTASGDRRELLQNLLLVFTDYRED
jgi:HEAT repeat protein